MGFPSKWNTCHRSDPIAAPRFKHQQEFCLGGKFAECPLFISQQAMPMPQDLRIPDGSTSKTQNNSRRTLAIALLFFVVVLVAGWGVVLQRRSSLAIGQATRTATSLAVPIVTVTATSASFQLPTAILTSTSADGTATRRPHNIYDWIGVNYIFRIYRVEQGLSLDSLASVYNTNVAAILAVNYKLSTPLVPGQLILIPINQEDVSGLPQFEIFHVTEDITIDELAAQLDVDPDQLRYYNDIPTSEQQLYAREWIIIPRERIKT
jgi:hypothetical protein